MIGSLVDRWDWRALFLGGILGQTATMTAMFVAVRHGTLGALPLAALFFVNSVSANTYLTAWKVGLGYLFPSFRRRARATLNTMYYATGVAGPLIAAVLVRAGDLTWFLIFDLVTFAAPVVSLAVIVRAGKGRPPRERPAPEAAAPGLLSDVAATFHLVLGDRVLRSLLVYFVFVAATPVSLLSSLITLRLDAHYSPLLMIALANIAIYCGNQTVSVRSDFAPGTVLVTGGLAAAAGVALLPVGSSGCARLRPRRVRTRISLRCDLRHLRVVRRRDRHRGRRALRGGSAGLADSHLRAADRGRHRRVLGREAAPCRRCDGERERFPWLTCSSSITRSAAPPGNSLT